MRKQYSESNSSSARGFLWKPLISKVQKCMWWIIFSLLFLIALLFLAANFPGLDPREDVRFGVTFSSRFARDLGLDPHETLQAIFSDIGIQKVRIPVYWDLVEKQKGVFDFSDIDWQLEMARQNGADVILAMGQKVPRWPECFVPEWAKTSEDEKNNAALSFLRETVERYRDHSEIVLWQVENEPFLHFGTCLPIEASVLDAEIALVRLADPSRGILTTDSGELSFWIPSASRGDVFGTTLYRRIWNERFGYFTYPIGPAFFRMKAALVRLFTDQKHFMIIELQGEPWGPGSFLDMPLSEQWKTMNAEKLREAVFYARQVGFSDVYLWGAEWWYWLKISKGESALWEEAKALLSPNH